MRHPASAWELGRYGVQARFARREGLAAAALAAVLAACGDGGGTGASVDGLVSLAIEPFSNSVGVGTSRQLLAIGTYDTGDTVDLTEQVEWSIVDDTGLIELSQTGLVTGNALGRVTVAATEPITRIRATAAVAVEMFPQEGSPAAPEPLDIDMPHDGTVNSGSSFYAVDVTPGDYYYTFLSAATDELWLYVYGNAAFSEELCLENESPGKDDEIFCIVQPTTDRLYVRVDGGFTNPIFGGDGGATFTLEVVRGYIDEGTIDAAVEVEPGAPVERMVGRLFSNYQFTPVAGAEYQIEVLDPTDDVDLRVAGNLGPFYSDRCNQPVVGVGGETCLLRAGERDVAFGVHGGTTRAGAGFRLLVTQTDAPLVAEGTAAAPLDLDGRFPYTGQVDRTESHYAYAISAGQSYRVELIDATAELSMDVYDGDSTFTTPDCVVTNGFELESPVFCDLDAATSGTIYIRVRANPAPFGAEYHLAISAR